MTLSHQLQWVRRPRTPVMTCWPGGADRRSGFNGSDVRERRLCGREAEAEEQTEKLQWVRRPRTPVMSARTRQQWRPLASFNGSDVRERRLCNTLAEVSMRCQASMGPTSENAGYVRRFRPQDRTGAASMGPTSENAGYASCKHAMLFRPACASMGPTSENAGYATCNAKRRAWACWLQWVRRPRTPVMMPRCPFWLFRNDLRGPPREVASMLHRCVGIRQVTSSLLLSCK